MLTNVPRQEGDTTSVVGGRCRELVAAFGEAAEVVLREHPIDSDLSEAEAARYLTRLMVTGALLEVEVHDPAYPQFVRPFSPWTQVGTPNPDTDYFCAPVDGRYEYRIYGTRGSAHIFDIELIQGDLADIKSFHLAGGLQHLRSGGGDLQVDPDGRIEIVMSAKHHDKNWIRLPDGLGFIIVRQYYNDWDMEEPGELYIERVGATYPPPAITAEYLDERLQLLGGWLRSTTGDWAAGIRQCLAGGTDKVRFAPLSLGTDRDRSDQVGFRSINYGSGRYQLQSDEAVILEVTPPECPYWSFHLTNLHWEALDWNVRQTSINGHQATLDTDGAFRAVIAQEDPRVPNWLDAAGHPSGLITGRYFLADSAPEALLQVVPLAKVRDYLPAATPVVTPEERSESIRRRMLSVHRRRCD